MLRLTALAIIAVGTGAAMASTVELGDAVSLEGLIAGTAFLNPDDMGGGNNVVGDKEFSDFTYSATGDMPSVAGVTVTPILDCDDNLGIRFQGEFLDRFGGNASDALITYTVSVTDPNRLISDMHLAGDPAVEGGTGFAGVTETFLPTFDDIQLNIFSNFTTQFSDWVILDPEDYQVSLNVQKNIIAEAGNGKTASITFIDQTFSQVPEPNSLGMILLATISGLALRRRR